MIDILLAVAQNERVGAIVLIELVIVLAILVVPLVLLIWFIRYLIRSGKERRLLRLEVGKLADEVHRLQQGAQQKSDEQGSG